MAGNLFAPQTQWGGALSGLVSSLHAGDPEGKRLEREAMIANKNADTDWKKAQAEKYRAEKEAKAAAARDQATFLANVVASAAGGQQQGADVQAAFGNAGVLPSQPETAEMPGIMGGYKPEGYDAAMRAVQGLSGAQVLGDKNVENAAKASGLWQQQGHIAQVAGQAPTPMSVAQAYFGTSGKAPFNFNAQVPVGNLVTGEADPTNPFAVASLAKTNSEAQENRAQAARYGRDDAPLVQVPDPSSPTGFKWSTRGKAVGQGAPISGATKVTDAFFPTATNRTRLQDSASEASGTLAIINEARKLALDERNFGMAGLVRETVQDAIQQGKAIGNMLGSQGSQIQQEIMQMGSDVGVQNFDATLPQLDMMMNILAFRMAKTNDPAGRVTDQDFRIAKSQISGGRFLGNQAEFSSRLDLMEKLALGQRSRDLTTLQGGRPAPGGAPPVIPGLQSAPKVINYDAQGNRLN